MSFLTSRTATSLSTSSLLRSAAALPLLRPATSTSTTIPRRGLARMTIVGRLGGTPEVVATSTGQDVVRYALATTHGPRDNRQTSWWKVACFAPEGGLRDLVTGLNKGSMVCVEGDCSMARYKDKEGVERGGLSIVQKNIEVLERRESSSDGSDSEPLDGAEAMGQGQ